MRKADGNQSPRGPGDYWRVGPVYVEKRLALLVVIGLSAAILLWIGLPDFRREPEAGSPPVFRYNDPALAEYSGTVQILDGQGRVRYIGEAAGGTYTGRGRVFGADGGLLYDGPLADGVYEGADAKVYRDGMLVYAGEMVGNLYEGQGRRLDPGTGIVSEGQFSKGLLEGSGQEFYPSGVLLREGTFSRDLLEGEGAEYSPEGILLWEGAFSAGLLHGEGRAYSAGGALRYEGQFWRGIYHGQGVLYHPRGNLPSAAGTFVYGKLNGQGTIYHPSGQLLYTGQVYEDRPRADAFLGLSLAEVEEAFTAHWLLYSCDDVTAFVYPYFSLMFLTESPVRLVSPGAVEEADGEEPVPLEDEVLSPDTSKEAVLITRVLSWGQPLPCVPQPETDLAAGEHAPGWREWFSDFASGEMPEGAGVRQSGPLVWRFTPWPEAGGAVSEFRAGGGGLETVTAYRDKKDMPLWYQTARWKEEA